MTDISVEVKLRLEEAAARSEYDSDLGVGEVSSDWFSEAPLVRAIYVQRARRWFAPVWRYFDNG